jgi:hypothetical protein
MGLSSSKQKDTPSGASVVAKKIETSAKTGVLNLAGQGLNSGAKTWTALSHEAMVGKIRSVDVCNNPLKTLPVEIYGLVGMKTLKASNCKLHTLYDLTSCIKLASLKLDCNELAAEAVGALPVSIGTCNLSNNRFDRLPPALLTLTMLIELELSGNRICSLEGIGELVALQALSLDDNCLVEIGVELSLLVRLRRLSLKNNRIGLHAVSFQGQSIAAEVFQLTSLDSIDLSGNTSLRNVDVFKFEGVEGYLERRKQVQDKALSGGALSDQSLFGLE